MGGLPWAFSGWPWHGVASVSTFLSSPQHHDYCPSSHRPFRMLAVLARAAILAAGREPVGSMRALEGRLFSFGLVHPVALFLWVDFSSFSHTPLLY